MNKGFRKLAVIGALFLPFLAGCEVGDDLPTAPTEEVAVELASLELLASSPQLQSDGSTNVTLTAIAKDANNQVVEGVSIVFSATSGSLTVENSVTDPQGIATATLRTGGNPSNRTIDVTSQTGTLSDAVSIEVIGTSMTIQGPNSLAAGDTGSYTVSLTDSGGNGIAGENISVNSSNGNSLSASSLVTDTNGIATFQVTGDNAGADTLTANATGLLDENGVASVSATKEITVASDSFSFTSPAADVEVNLNTPQAVTVSWSKDGVAQSGQTIRFATTRGSLDSSTAVTDANGDATVNVSSTTAGPAVITATNPEDTATQLSIEFVATNPAQISLQADPGVIGVNETSTITAIVQDAQNNRVKNQAVEFTLTDTTGGALSTASAITDSQGRAQTVYTASSVTSADDGVTISGTVVGTALTADTSLTVAGRALFIVFGTGNSIIEDQADTTYTKDYTVFVSDSSGKGVSDTDVSIRLLPTGYVKGELVANATTNTWVRSPSAFCDSEDLNVNGVLDTGEDLNADGQLTPGNIAVVAPGTVTTDANGQAFFQVSYPQNYALWVEGRITASATVAGTESRKSADFLFPMSAEDAGLDNTPPNPVSPWGVSANCTDTD